MMFILVTWNIFKDIINRLVDISIKHGKLSLAGIGVFRLLKSKPRAGKVGVYKFVPRFRFSPSTRINKYLEDNAIQVTDGMLESVSSISCNNDTDLGQVIAEAYTKVGKDGVVLMENSENPGML